MTVQKPDFINGPASSRVVREIASESKRRALAQPDALTAAMVASIQNPAAPAVSQVRDTDTLAQIMAAYQAPAAPQKTGEDRFTGFGGARGGAVRDTAWNREAPKGAGERYSPLQSAAGALQKGLGQFAEKGGEALAFAEDVILAPFEVFSGQELGELSDSGPFNTWAENIRREQAAVREHYRPNMERGGAVAATLENLGTAAVAAVPQAVLAMLTMGGSAAAQTSAGLAATAAGELSPSLAATAANTVKGMARDPQYWAAFSQVVGGSYEDALADGASRDKALFYALGNGLLNAAVEVGGGIQTLPGELAAGKAAWRAWVDSMLDEGKEEVVQGVIERAMQNAAYDRGNPLYSATDGRAVFNPVTAGGEFAGGAAVGGILGGGQIALGRAGNALLRRNASLDAAGTQAADGEGTITPDAQRGTEGVLGTQKAAPEMGTAVNENGLAALTEREQINLSGGKKNKIVTTFQEAVTFIQNALFNKQSVDRAFLGKVPDSVSQKVLVDTGVDISGYNAILPSDAVRHMFKNHGDPFTEQARGQVSLTPETAAEIPAVISAPDRVYLSPDTDARGLPTLIFEKQIGDYYITAQAIADGTHSIQTDTLYIRKKNSQDTVFNADASTDPGHNAQSVPPQSSSGESIPLPGAEGKGDVLEREAQRLFGQPAGEALQADVPGGTMEQTDGQEADYGRGAAQADQAEGEGLLRKEGYGDDAHRGREESLSGFLERESAEGRTVRSTGRIGYGYRPVPVEAQTAYTGEVLAELRALGVEAFAYDGELRANVNGRTVRDMGEAATLRDGSVGVPNREAGELTPREIAAHEAFHAMSRKRLPEAAAFQRAVEAYALVDSELFQAYAGDIVDQYFSRGFNYADPVQKHKFMGELCAYLSGDLYEGAVDVSGMFSDFGAVRSAWASMLESGRTGDGLGAADAGFDPYSRLQNQTGRFHPEGANAARAVDVPMENFDGSSIPKSASTILGAQGLDGQDVRFLERQIAEGTLSFDTITDEGSVARAHGTMAEKGFDGALEQYRRTVRSGVATKDNTTLGQQLLLQAMREGNTAYTAELLSLYTRNATTAAQALQAQSIFRKLSPQGQLVAVQKAVDALNEKHGTHVALDEADVADFLGAATEAERQAARERMLDQAASAVPGTFKAKFDTLRYLAMLGNPKTHIRNILGNTLFQPVVAAKNRVGALAEAAAYQISGGKVERTKALLGANPFGALAGEARADWVNVRDFLGSTTKYAEQTALWNIEERADAFSDKKPVGRGINALSEFNSRALEAEDMAAKRLIYAQSLAGYLKANGVKSIREAAPALLNRARTYAAEEAMRNTFNDHNAVSDAVSKLGGAARSDNPAVRAAGYVVEGVLPFKRTPANILVRAAEYSPVGAGLGILDTVRGARSGDAAQIGKGLDRLAAGLTGTALLTLGALAAGAGYVTGGGDRDKKQAAFDNLTGHQPYALELKDGTSVTLDWLAPEAIPFFMGVELYNAAVDGGLSLEDLGGILKNATAPMLELSMLQGLNDMFDNAAYAKNRGESVLGNVLASALTSYVTQVFPTLGGQIERIGEDVRMSTYTDKNSPVPTDLQYTLGKVSAKVPGWDYHQVPYIDAWGREEATGDVLERAVNNLFNPAYTSRVDVSAVERELQRLADATGETGVFPARAARYFDVGGERKDLTAEEYQTYAKALGQGRYTLVRQAMASEAYAAMDDAGKAAFVDKMYQVADAKARKQTVSAFQYSEEVQRYIDAEREGITPMEFYAYKEATGDLRADKDKNGESIPGSKKEKVIAAIDEQDLSPTEKDWLYLLNYDGKSAQKDLRRAPWNR